MRGTDRENAYFTVEAAIVLSIVICVIAFLMYILFFQYNRCLMEQDAGVLAVKGCSIQEDDKDALMLALMQYEDKIYREKYIAWDLSDMEMKLEGGTIEVAWQGELKYPFFGVSIGNIGNRWHTTASYENHRMNPVGFIRIYRKLTGGI